MVIDHSDSMASKTKQFKQYVTKSIFKDHGGGGGQKANDSNQTNGGMVGVPPGGGGEKQALGKGRMRRQRGESESSEYTNASSAKLIKVN